MGNYVSESDFTDRVGRQVIIDLTDRDGLNEIDETRFNKAVDTAESIIDTAFTQAGITTPLDSPSEEIKELAFSIAMHLLFSWNGQENKKYEKSYSDAIAKLAKVKSCEDTLGFSSPRSDSVYITNDDSGHVMDEDNLVDLAERAEDIND